MREALGDEEAQKVMDMFGMQSLEALMSSAPRIREFMKGSATALVLRTIVHWKVKDGGGEKIVTNDHLQAIFTCGDDPEKSSGLMAAAIREAHLNKADGAELKSINDFKTLLFDRL